MTDDGWFRTGDVATIDPDGYMPIVDRTKDVIKSGGEWISSVELENAIMAHPKVLEARVIGAAAPELAGAARRLRRAQARARDAASPQDGDPRFLGDKVARWWLPDEIRFIDEVPKTSAGKFDKKVLRAEAAPARRVGRAVIPSPHARTCPMRREP